VESIGIVLNTIEANTFTADLLKQSQTLDDELQSRQQVLQLTNAELGGKGGVLVVQNAEVERKNREVEQARQALEEKERQLALTSNTSRSSSRTCRTSCARRSTACSSSPTVSSTTRATFTPKQVEFSRTFRSGKDLLVDQRHSDLSKIESGTVSSTWRSPFRFWQHGTHLPPRRGGKVAPSPSHPSLPR
jgi:hypothetical protein